MIDTTLTMTTVWLLMLTTQGGMQSLQSVHTTAQACEAAREKYTESRYYTVSCDAKESLR
jgi:acid phosphatase family membrane protein YuiD